MTAARVVTIVNRQGLHARPSTRIVEVANRHKSSITLRVGDLTANAKSVLSLLALAAPQGTELAIEASGEDEAQAVAELAALVESGFGE
jgi:phosphotransferase system HPr (HPr) family protein